MDTTYSLTVNGQRHAVTTEPQRSLLHLLREEMRFAEGQMRNAAFSRYPVPRLADVPELDIHLLNRPDLESAGGGETPIIAIAPAIANAVFHANGRRIREMPICLRATQDG